jgi:hemerythrin superfamily protein
MNVYTLLKKDHEKVKGIFKALGETTERAVKKRETLFAQLKSELTVHAEAEEALFYPRVLDPKETHEITLEALEEHKVVKTLLAELDADAKDTEEWAAKLKVLQENVEHHVEEEEDELFKKAQKVLSNEEAESIAEEIASFKEEATTVQE